MMIYFYINLARNTPGAVSGKSAKDRCAKERSKGVDRLLMKDIEKHFDER